MIQNKVMSSTLPPASNVTTGSKPYIVEDRTMISRSSGDRGNEHHCIRFDLFVIDYYLAGCNTYHLNYCSLYSPLISMFLPRSLSLSLPLVCVYNIHIRSQNYTHTRAGKGRNRMFNVLLFADGVSHIVQMSMLRLSRIYRQ